MHEAASSAAPHLPWASWWVSWIVLKGSPSANQLQFLCRLFSDFADAFCPEHNHLSQPIRIIVTLRRKSIPAPYPNFTGMPHRADFEPLPAKAARNNDWASSCLADAAASRSQFLLPFQRQRAESCPLPLSASLFTISSGFPSLKGRTIPSRTRPSRRLQLRSSTMTWSLLVF